MSQKKKVIFKLIVCHDKNLGIGFHGNLPWSCPEEMKYFKKVTSGHHIVMGRTTAESIKKVLPDRINHIITSKQTCKIKNAELAKFHSSPLDFIRYISDSKNHAENQAEEINVFVIGGAKIYKWFMDYNLISEYYITELNENYKCDIFFPRHILADKNCALIQMSDLYCKESNIFGRYYVFRNINVEEEIMLDLMREIFRLGVARDDRTKVGTLSVFGRQLRFNLRNNSFPLMTTRRLWLRGIFEELMFYIRGQSNNRILEQKGVHVWTSNTTREFLDSVGMHDFQVGDMGASYGFNFRHFGAKYRGCDADYKNEGFDQLTFVLKEIEKNPTSRRLIIDLWDPTQPCALPPCLYNYQFYVKNGELSCMMTQRSSDYMVAGGWNVATGALLTYLIARSCDLTPGELVWNIGDIHLYNNVIDAARMQTVRTPYIYPKLFIIGGKKHIEQYEFCDLELLLYNSHDKIEIKMNA